MLPLLECLLVRPLCLPVVERLVVDDTLSWLSRFSINIPTFLGDPIVLDLGVDYDPEVPLDEALSTVSDSLVDIPDSLRSLEGSLADAELNLLVVRNDLNALAENLDTANQQLAEVAPELEALAEDVAEIQLIVEESQDKLPEQMRLMRYLLWGLSSMVMLSQIPGLYFGIVLQRHELAKPA